MNEISLVKEDFERICKTQLRIKTYTKSIESLFGLRQLSRIDYQAYYQRNYVWDRHKGTYFIESILLGTEIPPLIFFSMGKDIEVIDGRQRFETIERFKSNQLTLTKKGLSSLKKLAKHSYNSLLKDGEGREIIEIFLCAKIRIIEFDIVGDYQSNSNLIDNLKKEIFKRYNSGITSIKRADIDNAIYVKDPISIYFKKLLKEDVEFAKTMFGLFFFNEAKKNKEPNVGKILQFIRRHLVLSDLPIVYYARGTNRLEIAKKLYQKLVNESRDFDRVCLDFVEKIQIIEKIQQNFEAENYQHHRLVYECLLWSLSILKKEGIDLQLIAEPERLKHVGRAIYDNIDKFIETESHYYGKIVDRFSYTALVISNLFNLKLDVYISASSEATETLKKLRESQTADTITKLSELKSLRTNKPSPSTISVDDISRFMNRQRYIIRPAYQREEVINLTKASAIIESILLGITLPPIFVFKRLDNIYEVVDGQQRLLSILGFIGTEYIDESGERRIAKNHEFKLRGLNILSELNHRKFKELSNEDKDKILDFGLLVVEIEESLNPEFNPVDLFVRINDKPYPIKENSFEMWNSWADRGLIEKIKTNFRKHQNWFFIRGDGSRMENEELYTSLGYLEYQKKCDSNIWKHLYTCKQHDRLNVRIVRGKEITKFLELASQDEAVRTKFYKSIRNVERFIRKLKLVLLDRDIEYLAEKEKYFISELNSIFKAQKKVKSYQRAKQDFYVLWCAISPINEQMLATHRIKIKQDIKKIFNVFKETSVERPKEVIVANFKQLLDEFHARYEPKKRKLKLTSSQKNQAILDQGGQDPISGAPLFIGDDSHLDHIKPLAVGGKDSIENIQITHPISNLSKGARYQE